MKLDPCFHAMLQPELPARFGAGWSPVDRPAPRRIVDGGAARRRKRFWARGDGATYRVMIFAKHLGFMPATQVFTAGKAWKEHALPLSAFALDGKDLMGILRTAGPGPGKFVFAIDDVRFE